jgi:hypothetical protein
MYKNNPELVKRCLRRHEKSSLELKMESIMTELKLPYKFVGNGEVVIGGKNPDFVNCNGEKVAVEVYYRKHKEKFRGGTVEWMNDRQRLFQMYGWKLVFFDETETNVESVSQKLG